MKLSELKARLNNLEPEFLELEAEIVNQVRGKEFTTFLKEVTKDGLFKATDTLVDMDLELSRIYELWNAQGKRMEVVEQYVCDLGLVFHTLIERPWGVVWSIQDDPQKWFTRYAGRIVKTIPFEESK